MVSRTTSTRALPVLTALAVLLTGCDVQRNPGSGVDNPVVQIVVSPESLTLDPFENHQFQVFGRTQVGDSVPVAVRWTASAGTITSGGMYTADTSAADVLVTATLTGATLSGTSNVKKRRVIQVVISPKNTTIPTGGARQFTAYGIRNTGDSVNVNVSFTATGGAISGNGMYTAGQTAGIYRVVAKQNGGSLADTSAVTVTTVPVASVTVTPAAPSLQVGQSAQLTATPRDAGGNALSGRVVTWATSNAAVASVNGSGLVTGVAVGPVTITATSEGQSGSATVTVSVVPVASVAVSPATANVQVGQSAQLTATPRDAGGNALSGRVVTWATSNAAVASVNGSGLVTGAGAGTATITASSEGQSGSAAVAVTATVTNPGTVANLTVAGVTANSVTLSFTEVTDGAGQPAKYDVRWAAGALSWPAATSVAQGTCAVPMAGTAIGATRSCTVMGLASGTAYQFQLVAFRGTLNVDAVFGAFSNVASGTTTGSTAPVDTVFAEDFESGNLNAWQDGVDPARHRVVTDAAGAHSGSHYLDVTYPAGADGGWLTHFFMPGYDSLYVSVWVRFPTTWQGSTKLIAFYGSRTDNQWSAFGQAGKCPTGTDFFAAMVVTEQPNVGAARFYTYYPAMAREPDGVTCWGRYGDGTETYVPPLSMGVGGWHRLEFWVRLNTPGQANASQTFWLDGVQRGSWAGFSFRTSTILRLNSVQLTFSSGGAPLTEHLAVDHLVVLTGRPVP
jgi:uncharacterized protein YjdB